jgi:hypothetical protein
MISKSDNKCLTSNWERAYWGIRKQEEPQNVDSLGDPQNYLQHTPWIVVVALFGGWRGGDSRLAASSVARWGPYMIGDEWWWSCSRPRLSVRGRLWMSWFGKSGVREWKWRFWTKGGVVVAQQSLGRRRYGRHRSWGWEKTTAWFSHERLIQDLKTGVLFSKFRGWCRGELVLWGLDFLKEHIR